VYGSAVCVYNLTAFDVAFDGPFKYQRDSQSAWTRVHNSAPINVSSHLLVELFHSRETLLNILYQSHRFLIYGFV